jgi:hypothetical protein
LQEEESLTIAVEDAVKDGEEGRGTGDDSSVVVAAGEATASQSEEVSFSRLGCSYGPAYCQIMGIVSLIVFEPSCKNKHQWG